MVRVLLTKRAAAERVGFHPEHIMRLARTGKFPTPIKLGDAGGSAVRFLESEIDAWLDQKISQRVSAARS
jgi:predicted DNA-binding transcriptional regulator AlpA